MPGAPVRVAVEDPAQPDVLALIGELDAYQHALYPPESIHGIDLEALARPNVVFAVARSAEGAAVGCGALLLDKGFAEIKRMFVKPQHRGQGIGKSVLAFLEADAARRGYRLLMLETGVRQPEALGLYARCGYVRRGPFANYRDDPLSVFMYKPVGG